MVVDASLVVDMILGRLATEDRRFIMAAELRAPDVLMVEVLSALTSMQRRGAHTRSDVGRGLDLLDRLPIDLVTTRGLIRDAASFTDRFSAYDACYVALATMDETSLATTDRRLAGSHNLPIEVVAFTPVPD